MLKKIIDSMSKASIAILRGVANLIFGLIFIIIVLKIWDVLTLGQAILAALVLLCTYIILKSHENSLDSILQFASARRYNEDNLIVSSDFYQKVGEGHWMKTITIENIANPHEPAKFIVEHFRTEFSFNNAQDPRAEEISLNRKIVYGERESKITVPTHAGGSARK